MNYISRKGIEPILKYIPDDVVVWCLFDKEQSEFVKLISKKIKYTRYIKLFENNI